MFRSSLKQWLKLEGQWRQHSGKTLDHWLLDQGIESCQKKRRHDTQHSTIQHNYTQLNDIKHNNIKNVILSITTLRALLCWLLLCCMTFMLSATNKPFVLSVTNKPLWCVSLFWMSLGWSQTNYNKVHYAGRFVTINCISPSLNVCARGLTCSQILNQGTLTKGDGSIQMTSLSR